jgi:hypothetical protein
VLLVASCGDLSNGLLQQGVVRGTVQGGSSTLGLVAVFGRPVLRDDLAADGAFEVKNVPAGKFELFVVASRDAAVRLPVELRNGQVLDVGLVVPQAAAYLLIEIDAPGHLALGGGSVTVAGTPYEALRLDDSGHIQVGPLAAGHYSVSVAIAGVGERAVELDLLAGEAKSLRLDFPSPDGGEGHEGCLATGCSGTDHCTADGRCVQCQEKNDCGPGLLCVNERCEGAFPACSPCTEAFECRSGRCEAAAGLDDKECVDPCSAASPCTQPGFQCVAERCVPIAAELASCYAFRQVGAPCSDADSCRAAGILNGVCAEGSCAYGCEAAKDCPEGFECLAAGATKQCRRSLDGGP